MLRTLSRFSRSRDGTVAVEAIFIIPIFFLMVISLMEVGAYFYRVAMIDAAVNETTRTVITGQAPLKGTAGGIAGVCANGRECFFDTVCERVEMFGDCDDRLSVELAAFDTIKEVLDYSADLKCPNTPGYTQVGQTYEPGDRNQYIFLRVCFLIEVLNPSIGATIHTDGTATRKVVAIAIRRNEPYLGRNKANPNEVE